MSAALVSTNKTVHDFILNEMKIRPDPIVIGGSGGSGTRVFAEICALSGIYMGQHLNRSYDALEFVSIYEKWINKLYSVNQGSSINEKLNRDLINSLKHHCYPIQNSREMWGWKNPRSMLLLPYFDELFPQMKFIHVIRDGRDMAFSENQNQLIKHGEKILGKGLKNLTVPQKLIRFWARTNLDANLYGVKRMGSSYMCIKYEDLCFNTEATIQSLLKFTECKSKDAFRKVSGLVKIPDTVGRWQNTAAAEQRKITKAGYQSLSRFGYIT